MSLTHWDGYWGGPGVPGRPLALHRHEEPRRPERPKRIPFEVTLAGQYDSELAPFRGAVVPMDFVRAGDRQVLVQGRLGTPGPDEPETIDRLAEFESVESIVADLPVRLLVPLPNVRELIVTTGVPGPDEEALRNLPNLRSLCLGRYAGGPKIDLRLLARMPHLEDLRFHAAQIATIEPIGELSRLRRLRIEDHTFESIAPLAAVTGLRWLAIGWWKGMDKLRTLAELEYAELVEGTVSSLRAFRNWSRVRELIVFGRRLKSLAGIERLEALEELYLYNTAVTDLEPLTALPRLRRLRLDMPREVADFAPIGRLTGLETLILDFKGSSSAAQPRLADFSGLRSLRDLAVNYADGEGWRFVLDLPHLRRIRLYGTVEAEAPQLIRARFRDATVDVRPVAAYAEEVAVKRQPDGRWFIDADATRLLGVEDNFAADRRLRRRLAETDPQLVDRLEFDTEADALVVIGSEADVRRVREMMLRFPSP